LRSLGLPLPSCSTPSRRHRTDKFYPDFIAELTDGRILVVEYKGADRWSNDDSKEKRAVGELWADRSQGKCLFIMPQGPDWPAIEAKINS
jgi:type III restriction enzyme